MITRIGLKLTGPSPVSALAVAGMLGEGLLKTAGAPQGGQGRKINAGPPRRS